MIGDLLIGLIALFIGAIQLCMASINFFIPVGIQTAVSMFFGYLNFAQGIIPVVPNPLATGLWHDYGLLSIVGWFLVLVVALEFLNIVMFFAGFLPWFHLRESDIVNRTTESQTKKIKVE